MIHKIASILISLALVQLLLVGCYRTQVTDTGISQNPPEVKSGVMLPDNQINEFLPNAKMYIFLKGESLQTNFDIKTLVKQNNQTISNTIDTFPVINNQPLTNDPELLQQLAATQKENQFADTTISSSPQQWPYLIVLSRYLNEQIYPKGEPLMLEIYVNDRLLAWHRFEILPVVNNPPNVINDTISVPQKTIIPETPKTETPVAIDTETK